MAARQIALGADGICAFNWHADRNSKRELLTQVGASDTLRCRDKLYNVTHRFRVTSGEWRGAYQHDRLRGQLPVALHRTLAGGGPEFALELGDDIDSDPPASVVLRLRLGLHPGWRRQSGGGPDVRRLRALLSAG